MFDKNSRNQGKLEDWELGCFPTQLGDFSNIS